MIKNIKIRTYILFSQVQLILVELFKHTASIFSFVVPQRFCPSGSAMMSSSSRQKTVCTVRITPMPIAGSTMLRRSVM